MTATKQNLVHELRALVLPIGVTSIARADLFNEAADEIERLRAALELIGADSPPNRLLEPLEAWRVAREALANDKAPISGGLEATQGEE